ADQGTNIGALIDGNHALARDALATAPRINKLVRDASQVLATQIAETGALRSFRRNALLLARELADSNASLPHLLDAGPHAPTPGLLPAAPYFAWPATSPIPTPACASCWSPGRRPRRRWPTCSPRPIRASAR